MNDISVASVIEGFGFPGELVECTEIRTGHINRTYRLAFSQSGQTRRYLLQRINTFVFRKPDEVMENVLLVTEHLRRALEAQGVDASRRVLRVVMTGGGLPLYMDARGGAWRAYDYLEGAHSVDQVESPAQFEEVGRAFGDFQSMLADFPIEKLHDTIPDFHDTVKRMAAFEASVLADAAGRASQVGEEIEKVRRRRGTMGRIVEMLKTGALPLRVTHNDTKCNNVMVDDATGRAMCVVDLDTVMAGSVLYDFGDAIRFGASTAAEDEPDVGKVRLDMAMFDAYARGFISRAGAHLTRAELDNLPLGAMVMTYENGLRFLKDYLDGDVYYRIDYPEHNLVRARCQFRLLENMESRRDEMEASIARYTLG